MSFHTGSAEVLAHARLLQGEEANAGETVWAQLELQAPVAVVKGDYFVIRSPNETLGGGQIIDPRPRRHKRNRPEVIAALETLAKGSPDEVVLQTLGDKPPVEFSALVGAAGLPEQELRGAVERLVAAGEIVQLGGDGSTARPLKAGHPGRWRPSAGVP